MEFTNINKIKQFILESRNKPFEGPSVFQSFSRLFLFLILYFSIAFIVMIIMIMILTQSSKMVRMPDVTKKNFFEAYQILHSLNLIVDTESRYVSGLKPNVVISQSIRPDIMIKENRVVKLVVNSAESAETVELATNVSEDIYRSVVLRFTVPQDNTDIEKRIRIEIIDENDKIKVVYDQLNKPGEIIRVPLKIKGKVKQRVFIDEVLAEEKEIE